MILLVSDEQIALAIERALWATTGAGDADPVELAELVIEYLGEETAG